MEFKRGDWRCDCGKHNFARRDICFSCRQPKRGARVEQTRVPGDWDCPNCHEVVFRSRDKCRKCGSPNPNYDPNRPKVNQRPGDWNCECGDLNFGTRVICRSCGKARENPQGNAEGKDLDCVVCWTNKAIMAPSNCGHRSMCEECSRQTAQCPICRANFTQLQLVKIYDSGIAQ